MSQNLTSDNVFGDLNDQNASHLTVSKQAPRSDWSEMGDDRTFRPVLREPTRFSSIRSGASLGPGCGRRRVYGRSYQSSSRRT